jgi:hypothetical protein
MANEKLDAHLAPRETKMREAKQILDRLEQDFSEGSIIEERQIPSIVGNMRKVFNNLLELRAMEDEREAGLRKEG